MVSAKSLTVRYGRSRSPQLSEVTTRIGAGVTALVGKNGAGKTTLIKAMVGLLRVESGNLSVLGQNIAEHRLGADRLGEIGYLPQDFGYVASFTVREFVEYGAWLKRVPSAGIRAASIQALEFVGLSDKGETKMRRLSGGMRRRAGIAQTMVHDPKLLILDEPTTGLDPEQRVRFRALIRRLASDRAVVLSSHLVEDVRAVASQVLVLEDGRLRFDGTVAQLEDRGGAMVDGETPLENGYLSVLRGQ